MMCLEFYIIRPYNLKKYKRAKDMDHNNSNKERIKYRTPMFRFEMYHASYPKDIKWHWHDEFELSYVTGGKIIYRTATKEVTLEDGDAVFVNANTIHSLSLPETPDTLQQYVHFFDNHFIAGVEGNVIDVNYVYPIQHNENIDIIVFKANDEKYKDFHALLRENSRLKQEKDKYYELDLRKNVCELWKFICESVDLVKDEKGIPSLPNKRIRESLKFIQKHYKEKITLNDIANYIHISTRECDRMFKKYLKISPIQYLHTIRLEKATSMLLDVNKSISEIATENGFASSSHFGMKFKDMYNMTPKQYREKMINQ